MGAQWFAGQTKPNCEIMALTHLRQQNYETWMPRLWTRRRREGRVMPVVAPMFKQYLFVHVDLSNERWLAINSTRGMHALLQVADGRPIPVADKVIEDLRYRLGDEPLDEAQANTALQEFLAGDAVRLEEGPFADYSGIVIDTEKDRAKVALMIFGRQTPVWASFSGLTKIGDRSARTVPHHRYQIDRARSAW
jgi:transcriptional antiterminator NusG